MACRGVMLDDACFEGERGAREGSTRGAVMGWAEQSDKMKMTTIVVGIGRAIANFVKWHLCAAVGRAIRV